MVTLVRMELDWIERVRNASREVAEAEAATAEARQKRRELLREATEAGKSLSSLEEPAGMSRQAIVKDMARLTSFPEE